MQRKRLAILLSGFAVLGCTTLLPDTLLEKTSLPNKKSPDYHILRGTAIVAEQAYITTGLGSVVADFKKGGSFYKTLLNGTVEDVLKKIKKSAEARGKTSPKDTGGKERLQGEILQNILLPLWAHYYFIGVPIMTKKIEKAIIKLEKGKRYEGFRELKEKFGSIISYDFLRKDFYEGKNIEGSVSNVFVTDNERKEFIKYLPTLLKKVSHETTKQRGKKARWGRIETRMEFIWPRDLEKLYVMADVYDKLPDYFGPDEGKQNIEKQLSELIEEKLKKASTEQEQVAILAQAYAVAKTTKPETRESEQKYLGVEPPQKGFHPLKFAIENLYARYVADETPKNLSGQEKDAYWDARLESIEKFLEKESEKYTTS